MGIKRNYSIRIASAQFCRRFYPKCYYCNPSAEYSYQLSMQLIGECTMIIFKAIFIVVFTILAANVKNSQSSVWDAVKFRNYKF